MGTISLVDYLGHPGMKVYCTHGIASHSMLRYQ